MLLIALTTNTDVGSLVNYGLGGLIFVSMVVPMAIYIVRDKDRQIAYREEELARAKAELNDLRRVLEPIAPTLQDMGRTVQTAITLLERSRP